MEISAISIKFILKWPHLLYIIVTASQNNTHDTTWNNMR